MSTEQVSLPEVITAHHLESISKSRFGESTAGINASTIIDYERQRFSGEFFSSSDPTRMAWEPSVRDPHSIGMHEATLPFWNANLAGQSCAAEALSKQPPFRIEYEVDNLCRTVRIKPAQVTPHTLATYVQSHHLDKHRLRQGALPRAIEILLQAAGVESPLSADTQLPACPTSSLSPRADVHRYFNKALGYARGRAIMHRVDDGILRQLETGQPLADGELVVEGLLSLTTSEGSLHYSELHRPSLPAVLSLYNHGAIRTASAINAYAAR